MKSSKNNPNSNVLGAGLNENQIDDAISKSGYPLQLEIARILKPKFGITEEWGYYGLHPAHFYLPHYSLLIFLFSFFFRTGRISTSTGKNKISTQRRDHSKKNK